MTWFLVAIFSYLLAAITAIVDDCLLAGSPNPKSYVFYAGILGILIIILIPFIDFSIPNINQLGLSILAGSIFILALFGFYTALENFEASRVVPAIGGLLPIFTLILTCFFSTQEALSQWKILAFGLLLLGSIFITIERGKKITLKSFRFSMLVALLFSLSFFLAKYVYLNQPFWQGFIWMRIGGFLTALCFVFTKEVKEEIVKGHFTFQKKTGIFFLSNQVLGAISSILQNWAIALVPLGLLAFINALEGTKFVFLLIFASILSLKFPRFLSEQISKKIIFQKIFAILLIGLGLTVLAFK